MSFLFTFAALIFGACTIANSCDEYVDYMCDCHGDDPEVDCEEFANVYGDADAETQIACEDEYDAQLIADEDDGLECVAP
jgi:hypothetical protein